MGQRHLETPYPRTYAIVVHFLWFQV